MISLATLVACGLGPVQAQNFIEPLKVVAVDFNIGTPSRMAAFLGQCMVESGNFAQLEEGLFYRSADRIMEVFRGRVGNLMLAKALVGRPQMLANTVYAGRNGNGNFESGDGWNYRGRGLIQVTGRKNYQAFADATGLKAIERPDLLAEPYGAVQSAAWYWQVNALNKLADAGSVDAITRAVNGPGMMHAAERRAATERALRALT